MQDDLKHRMYDYEERPPAALWDSIAANLEEEALVKSMAERLKAWQVVPPATAWRNILSALKQEAPVRHIRFGRTYKWSAAAAVILVAGSLFFLNKHTGSEDTAKPSMASSANPSTEDLAKEENDSGNKGFVSPVKLVSSPRHNRQKAYNDEQAAILPMSYVESASPVTDELISITAKPILTSSGELIQDMSVVNPHNDKYVSITAPNGQQTKVSSRLINAVRYFSDSEPDLNAKDTVLQQRVHEWRKKIMQSGFVPSSNNFMDILEMTDLVSEKKQS